MNQVAHGMLDKDQVATLASVTHSVMASLAELRHTVDVWLIDKGIEAADREVLQDAITDQIIEGSRRRT